MPTYKLLVKATLENIESLEVASPDWYHFKVECQSCRTVSAKEVGVSTTETIEAVKSVVNLSYRCPECKRTHSLTIDKKSARPITAEQNGQWVSIVEFDCRGLAPFEPTLFGTRWTASPSEGAPDFHDVDLSEDWADYDTKNDCSVSILDAEIKVE